MPHKEGFIACYILYAHDVVVAFIDDFVHKQEGVTVRKQLAYTVNIHKRLYRRIVYRGLQFLMLDLLAYLLGKCSVD